MQTRRIIVGMFDTHQGRDMNAAKKIRKLIESGTAEGDMAVLVDLARSLETGIPFQLAQLNTLDMRHFDLAMELIADWRFDHHIPARRKLTDVIMNLHEQTTAESVGLEALAERIDTEAEANTTAEAEAKVEPVAEPAAAGKAGKKAAKVD